MKHIHISVPGSMMIFGEYFITNPNNSALCIAINKRATLDIKYTASPITASEKARDSVELETRYEGKIEQWESPEHCDMYRIAWDIYDDFFPENTLSNNDEIQHNTNDIKKISAVIDTSAFFKTSPCYCRASEPRSASGEPATEGVHAIASPCQQPAHAIACSCQQPAHAIASPCQQPAHAIACNAKKPVQKLGLGSSEASALLFCVLILIVKNKDIQTHKNILATFATKVHYIWQGKSGSGYGIYTSLYGNIGIFHKTKEGNTIVNVWEPLPKKLLAKVCWYYCMMKHSVSTKLALQKFEAWKANNPTSYNIIQQQARNAIQHLSNITTEQAFITWIRTAAKIGKTLGDYIGVSATLDKTNMATERDIVWKATGAGNENAIGVSHKKIIQNNNATHIDMSIDIGQGLMIDIKEEK